jgi:hypothetical protein
MPERNPLYPVYIRLEDNARLEAPQHNELGPYMQFAPSRFTVSSQIRLSFRIPNPSQHTRASGTLFPSCTLFTSLQ